MTFTGLLKNLSLNWKTKKPEVTLELESANLEDLETLKEKMLTINLKQYRKKRSLEANAYYWVLCTKIAEKINQSAPWVHNYMLRKYGFTEIIEGKAVYLVIPDTEEAEKHVNEAQTYHLRPTSQVKQGKDGKLYRTYIMIRGSHDYDTKEMSNLINGTVSEAKDLGIETMTPDQIKEMMAAYEKRHSD